MSAAPRSTSVAVVDRTSAGPVAPARYRLGLFARMWAVAALFHLAGNSRDALVTSPPLALASVLLALAAGLTLLAPHRRGPVALLCVCVPVSAWYEAPVVGNHWVLAAAVSLVLLLAAVLPGASTGPGLLWSRFAPTARLVLLVAYGFAAFAKLNTGFLDPVVSCAVYYHNQLVGSWGLDTLQVPAGASIGALLGPGAGLTEVSVAVLLALPRLRRAGLVLAVGFHWLLAMDLYQHFWDFSSVLFATFLLFLDDDQVRVLQEWTRRVARRARALLVVRPALLVAAVTVPVLLLAVWPVPTAGDVLLVLVGHLAWWVYGTGVVLLVLRLALAPRNGATGDSLRPPAAVLYLLPVLVLVNGLTPYVELKTGFGWNMYSNLRTVAGQSNHLLVRGTLDLTGLQRDQVRILDSTDPELRAVRDSDYLLTYSEFREYAHDHPDVSVTYERGGAVHAVDRLAEDPAGQGGVSSLSWRLQSFRAIDDSGAERCQPAFSAAR